MPHSFKALGTTWWIEVFDETSDETLDAILGDIELFVASFENTYSRFKTESLISTLNTQRKLENPDEHCRTLLTFGKNLYLRTNTHFNILTGHILEARGYDANYSFTPQDETALTAGNPIADLLITPDVVELHQGNIDIGGFGKGYLVDEVALRLQSKHSIQYFVVNAGGDIYATSNHGQAVEIYLEHPLIEKTYIQSTQLLHQGFASSSPHKRQWKSPTGETHSHLVNSHNEAQMTTFVKTTTACEADVFATTALIAPAQEMQAMIQSEKLAVAFYNPDTKQLRSYASFFATETV